MNKDIARFCLMNTNMQEIQTMQELYKHIHHKYNIN